VFLRKKDILLANSSLAHIWKRFFVKFFPICEQGFGFPVFAHETLSLVKPIIFKGNPIITMAKT